MIRMARGKMSYRDDSIDMCSLLNFAPLKKMHPRMSVVCNQRIALNAIKTRRFIEKATLSKANK